MAAKTSQIQCPHCKKTFALDEALKSDLEGEFEKRFQEKLSQSEADFKKRQEALEKEKASLKKKADEVEEVVAKKLAQEQAAMEKKIKDKLEKSAGVEMQDLRSQVEEQNKKLDEANKLELEMRKKARELEQREKDLELESQRKLDSERAKIEEEVSKRAADENQLKMAEKDRKLTDALKQMDEMKRKMEQGSQQAQGETLELVLEDALKSAFANDLIEPVPKGMRGADIVQRVTTPAGKVAGIIVWELKRTKSFGGDWIDKLKQDQREITADIAVIVTQTMPKEMDTAFGQVNGVWVSDLKSPLPLAFALRSQLILVHQARAAMENQDGKLEQLYQYLTGTQFRQKVEAIVEGFTAMKADLDKEKLAYQKIWAAREKQLDKVLMSTASMHGDLQGLVGGSMPRIGALEIEGILGVEGK